MKLELKKNIKEKLFNFYSLRNLKRDKYRCCNIGFNNAKSIGILYQFVNSKNQKEVTFFIKELKKLGKKVQNICFIEKETTDFDYNSPSFGFEDLTYRGKIIDEEVRIFLDNNFDYLYFMEFEINPIMKYILSKSKAKCKIGFYSEENSKYLDLMVNFQKHNTDKDLNILINEFLKYSKIINN
ncbi:MAG: hypothetical protein GY830_10775 [Bacteroidetes bacterium]|nr:hypothetical protein [Bacteroidota bacterium]